MSSLILFLLLLYTSGNSFGRTNERKGIKSKKKKKIDASSSEEEKKWQEKRVERIGTSSNRLRAMATRNAALSLSLLFFSLFSFVIVTFTVRV